jgi:hypothetical protein
MQKYTELKLRELKIQHSKDREKNRLLIAGKMNANGLFGSSTHIDSLIIFELEYVQNCLDIIIAAEKDSLSNEKVELPENYFETLSQEIINIIESQFDDAYRGVGFHILGSGVNSRLSSQLDQKKALFKDSIRNNVEILKEELRLGMSSEPQSTTIHINGNVGAINTGTIYGSIHGEINKIEVSEDNELFTQLLDTINQSSVADNDKAEQMQHVELLVKEYNTPQRERKYGLIKTSMNFLATAVNLSTLWGQHGEALMRIFSQS